MIKNIVTPFHIFNHKGRYYMINIENMQAGALDKETAQFLQQMSDNPENLFDAHAEEYFKNLGLISAKGEERKFDIKKSSDSIINMALLVTQSCNLRCTYCYGDGGEYGTGGSMDEKTAYQAVEWLIEQSQNVKKINIIFFGGEPFINFPLIKKVVLYARKRAGESGKEVGFCATTNATLLDDEKISFLKENDIHVTVSIDGPKEIQDIQRPFAGGKGSYDVIVPNLKKLLEVFPETIAHSVLVDNTKIHNIKTALQEIGFKNISITPVSDSLFDEKTKSEKELDDLLQDTENEAEAYIRYIKSRDSRSLKELMSSGSLHEAILSLLHNKRKHYACGAGIKYTAVSCSGDIYLCHRFVGMDSYILGNVFTGEFNRGVFEESPLTVSKECSGCFAKYYCAGGCKHDNAASCGSAFKANEIICRIKRNEIESAAVVVSMLDNKDCEFLNENDIFPPKPCPLDF